MSEEIVVPVLGESITEATVSKWLKKSGENVKADEPIVELETDKVNLEVPSPVSGVLSNIKTKEGETVKVGALLGIVLVIELGILFLTDRSSNIYNNQTPLQPIVNEVENTKMIGQILYTEYFYLFQMCGIILLVAMIGSITLTLRDKGGVKRQNINSQNTVDASTAIEKKKVKIGEGI